MRLPAPLPTTRFMIWFYAVVAVVELVAAGFAAAVKDWVSFGCALAIGSACIWASCVMAHLARRGA